MSRVLVDTNTLVSAVIFRNGLTAEALILLRKRGQVCLTKVIINEAEDVIGRKWPDRIPDLWRFLGTTNYELLPEATSDVVIRDINDQDILNAAIAADVDIILTGDLDFHDLKIERPKSMTPRQYLDEFMPSDQPK